MTAGDLEAWREGLGWSRKRAAQALGVSYAMYRCYEAGQRVDGRPAPIPHAMALACAWIEAHGPEDPWSEGAEGDADE